MSNELEVTVLVDNTSARPGLSTEHGLSMWVAIDGKHILFDTGMGVALSENTVALGIDLGKTDAIVLSHGHFDHTGGLPHVLERCITSRIFMHPDAVKMRYGSLQTPPARPIGMRAEIAELLAKRAMDVVETTKPTRIADRVWVTGPIPRRTSFEDTGGPFFVDEECRVKDAITDDQAIWIDTPDGIVLLLGCAHSGVVNTLDYVAELCGTTRYKAIVGGMHLLNASAERLEATVDAVKRYQVRLIAPCHCTGEAVIPILAEQFPEYCLRAGAGSRFTWPF
ncbi:MAG: fold metallo-hydrolase [Candidatus Hydrogenedentes bacterium]|nr:fold metallo-hydrolase [Candidatus Hydrogenedentota bacterium]